MKLSGIIEIRKNGQLLQRFNNLVVRSGLELIMEILHNSNARPSHLALGTGAAPPELTQTALIGTEAQRKAVTALRTGTTLYYSATFGPGLAGGPFLIQELGLFNDAVGGTMISRGVSAPWELSSTDAVDIIWGLSIQ